MLAYICGRSSCPLTCDAITSRKAAGRRSASAGAEGGDQGGDDLVQVTDDGVVGVGEDRRARVGVDRDDVLGARAARDVLDGAADAAGQVELRGDLGAGLADLLPVRAPALGGDHP